MNYNDNDELLFHSHETLMPIHHNLLMALTHCNNNWSLENRFSCGYYDGAAAGIY